MTSYKFGDTDLVSFPFKAHAGSKRRPAVIISSAAYTAARRDVVNMAVTSQISPSAMSWLALRQRSLQALPLSALFATIEPVLRLAY